MTINYLLFMTLMIVVQIRFVSSPSGVVVFNGYILFKGSRSTVAQHRAAKYVIRSITLKFELARI
jgi:hypothetical protein